GGWVQVLAGQHRWVLGNVVSEGCTESAQAVCPAVSRAHDSLGSHLVSDAKAWRQVKVVHTLNTMDGDVPDAKDVNQAGTKIELRTISGSVYLFREDHFPAKTDIDRQLRRYAPGILTI